MSDAAEPTEDLYDAPSARELLEAVGEFLRHEVAPALDGQVRFHAQVAANVIRMVERELASGVEHQRQHAMRLRRLGVADEFALVSAIRRRSLRYDDPSVLEEFRDEVRDKLAVASPRYASLD